MELKNFFLTDGRMSVKEFIKKHSAIFTFILCVFLGSVSFCEQYYISAGNIFFLFVTLLALSFGVFCLMRCVGSVNGIYSYLTLIFAAAVSYIVLKYLAAAQKKAIYIFVVGFAALCIALIVLCFTKKLTANSLIVILFFAGILLRFTYVLYTSCGTRQHDVYNFGNDGHSGYIRYLYENGHLPDFDVTTVDQFYHPPLHHIICAIWWKILSSFGIADAYAQSSVQTLTLFYSCVCMIITYKILREFDLKGVALILPFAVIAFHPSFVIFSASINNDILSVTFMLLAILYSVKWYKSKKMKDIIVTAFAIGLGMMTKLSAYMVCFPIGFVFLVGLINDNKNYKKYIRQFAIFLIICAPLGLWWNFRNAISYNVPFLYIQRQGDGAQWQYVGDIPALTRIFDFSKLFSEPVFDRWVGRDGSVYNEYNPMISLLKTSVFGEYINRENFGSTPVVAENILFWTNVLLAIVSVVALVYSVIKCIKNKNFDVPLLSVAICFVLMILFYYVFCFSYPHHCTENIRYVSPLIVMGLVLMGRMLNDIKNSHSANGENTLKRISFYSVFSAILFVLVFLFCLNSCIMFIQLA